jgi:hypothetical protein
VSNRFLGFFSFDIVSAQFESKVRVGMAAVPPSRPKRSYVHERPGTTTVTEVTTLKG